MSVHALFNHVPYEKRRPTKGAGYRGLTLGHVWGTNFSMQGIAPRQAAILVIAHAFNLSGAHALGQHAPTRELLCYRQCAEYVQRHYKQDPNMKVAVLGSASTHIHCIVIDKTGLPLFDSLERARLSFSPERRLYTYQLTVQGQKAEPWVTKVNAEVSLNEAVQYLEEAGYWTDRSQSNLNPQPRGNASI